MYEDAPATKMLATNCACCARPLLDALSVESGMGPICRSKHGFSGKHAPQVSDEDRVKANKIVYAIALGLPTEHLAAAIKDLRDLGFTLLASVLEDRNVAVTIEGNDVATLRVYTPFNEAMVAGFRTIPGRRWSAEHKANIIPATQPARAALWALLKKHFAGQMMKTEKGLIAIPA